MDKIICCFIMILFLVQICLCDVTLNTNDMQFLRTYIHSLENENALLITTKSYYSNQYFYTYSELTNFQSEHKKEINQTKWIYTGISLLTITAFILGAFFGRSTPN